MHKVVKRGLAILAALAIIVTSIPGRVEAATTNKEVVVSTQKQLEDALKDVSVKKITVKTDKKLTFTVPAEKHAKVKIYFNAPKATIYNNSVFKKVVIKDAKKFYECATGNTVTSYDDKLTISIPKRATANLKLSRKNAAVKVNNFGTIENLTIGATGTQLTVAQKGKLNEVDVNKRADVALTGSTSKFTKIVVAQKAKDAAITSSVKVLLTASADTKLALTKGAGGSSVTLTDNSVVVNVDNQTVKRVTCTDADGNTSYVRFGRNAIACKAEEQPAPVQPVDEKPEEPKTVVNTSTDDDDDNGGYTYVNPNNVTSFADVATALSMYASKVVINSDETGTLTIPTGNYPNTELVLNVPNATVDNSAKFKKITVQAVAPNTLVQHAEVGTLEIVTRNAHIILASGGTVTGAIQINPSVSATATGSAISFENQGDGQNINLFEILAAVPVAISGTNANVIPMRISAPATITTSLPVAAETTVAAACLQLLSGAQNSVVSAASDELVPDIQGLGSIEVTVGDESHFVAAAPLDEENLPEGYVIPTGSYTATAQVLTGTGLVPAATGSAFLYNLSGFDFSLSAVDTEQGLYSTTIASGGAISFTDIPFGNYALYASSDSKAYIGALILTGDIVDSNALVLADMTPDPATKVKVFLKNAFLNEPVTESVQVQLRKGADNSFSGEVLTVTDATTDADGSYYLFSTTAGLLPGYYTVTVMSTSYVTYSETILVYPGTTTVKELVLSPTVSAESTDKIRFILTWSDEDLDNNSVSADLDSHLVNNEFHIYFSKKIYYLNGSYDSGDTSDFVWDEVAYARLDVDDTLYVGPETTSVYNLTYDKGEYHFYVHDYSSDEGIGNPKKNTRLTTSGAKVRVYIGGQYITEFVPNGNTKYGNVWDVCTYNPTTNSITGINKIYYVDIFDNADTYNTVAGIKEYMEDLAYDVEDLNSLTGAKLTARDTLLSQINAVLNSTASYTLEQIVDLYADYYNEYIKLIVE